ncbi:hypothetical protein N5079_23905 [Planotetraspora sp. A-T 1434]|uniref:prenyltransferase/squalene oxidase repeat-containing protein n=1 Tax=Planotetraspora sp. A-T 1434 TaxID=2979219 RepID=UPI0021C20D53|nr:prenyltransferase/squalene oxidase repeat-containing protein [Planotetraspora sp. A-T 1434]MCT9933260.1 hypothetical protein [Planotetraspora sp. A-T 1434]
MTVRDLMQRGVDVPAAAGELVSGLMLRPWGTVSPSVYETGRLVTLAPWLTGHSERVAYLIAGQGADGGWGAPDGYALVPTLSATEALLCAMRRRDPGADHVAVAAAASRGLRVLFRWLGAPAGLHLPDLPAIELTVPSLIAMINRHLDEMKHVEFPGGRLASPPGLSDTKLAMVRARLESGTGVPEKLLHALEVAGDAASGASAIRPTPIGTVGASPAASAAWLGARGRLDPVDHVRRHLEAVAVLHGGPVPVGFPITVFERGWVLSSLARAGVPLDVPPEMVGDLRSAIGPQGTPAGPGLPPDADSTSVALYALALLGTPYQPDSLWAFETETHFCTWQGEEGASVSVNAHVLDAFGQYVVRKPDAVARYAPSMRKLSAWLCGRQRDDGSWEDRWHASPYYATVSCVLALDAFGGGASVPAVQRAVRKAVRWVLETQRPDGSWGRWAGTAEETAYCLQTLLLARSEVPVEEAATRGYAYLLRSADAGSGPPLWHDKDLYLPLAIVRAAVLAALHLAQSSRLVVDRRGQL